MINLEEFINQIKKRYGGVSPEALKNVLAPITIPINSINSEIKKETGQNHYRALFTIDIDPKWSYLMQRGTTGKFVPSSYVDGNGVWREICKGRIISVDSDQSIAIGEIYVGGTKSLLEEAVSELKIGDYLEIDQYGASAKILSSLAEYYLGKHGVDRGYLIRRMPEDTARHLGAYYNYDFEFEKDGVVKKIEAKSLWGTNTQYARLIHSKTTKPKGDIQTWTEQQVKNYYSTSSCKFSTQDIFAVNLFLRSGNIDDFAFAKSVSDINDLNGLPTANGFPEHVNQNPICIVDNVTWFASIDDVWGL